MASPSSSGRPALIALPERHRRWCVTLLVSSFVIYGSLYLAPGNPIATLTGGRTPSPEAIAILEHRYHLDEPVPGPLLAVAEGGADGDFGDSIPHRQEVSDLITGSGPRSRSRSCFYASLIILVVGIGLGIVGALRPGDDRHRRRSSRPPSRRPCRRSSRRWCCSSCSRSSCGWFPATGDGEGVLDRIYHLILPALALGMTSVALVTRVTRSAVREELGREHVQTAVSRGIPFRLVLRRHVLRNAAIPITTVVGLTIATLIALSAVVERAFGLNGLGSYLVEAAQNKDFAVVQGISLVLVAAFVVANTIVDIAYALLDPRVTIGSRAAVSISPPARRPRRRRRREDPGRPVARGDRSRSRHASRGSASADRSASRSSLVAVLLAIFGPLMRTVRPEPVQLRYAYVGPIGDHHLGFDGRGRDLL